MISKGTRVDRYIIEDELGRGGFGSVFLAKDTASGVFVAIKFLHPNVIRDNDAYNAFLDEMINQARLSGNPNIVRILRSVHFTDRQGGHLGMVMEFVDGETLDRTIRNCGLLPDYFAVPIILQALNGLDFAHRSGLLHRDIKPGNIIIDRDGLVKIMDFGLSKLMDEHRSASESARAGSLNYVAPERFGQEPIDVRSDIYSLGATFYEALTGQPPYEIQYGDWKTAEVKHKEGGFPSIRSYYPEHHRALDAVLSEMLDPLPARRYQGCSEIIRDLMPIFMNAIPPPQVGDRIHRLWERTGLLFKAAGPIPVMSGNHADDAGKRNSGSEVPNGRQILANRQANLKSNALVMSLPSAVQKVKEIGLNLKFMGINERFVFVRIMMIVVALGAALFLLWNELGRSSGERRAWSTTILAGDLASYESYLDQFPNGEHSIIAARLAQGLRAVDSLEEKDDFESALDISMINVLVNAPSIRPMNPYEKGFEYRPSGLRDPFKNLLVGRDTKGQDAVGDNLLSVDDIVLFGIVRNKGIFTAMIGLPQGFPFFAKIGDKYADGYLLSITETQIVLRKTHERGVPLMRPRDIIKEITEY